MFNKSNFKNLVLLFAVVIISGMVNMGFAQYHYAENLSRMENNLGPEAQAGMYSQNFRTSQVITQKGVDFLKAGDFDSAELEFNNAISMSDFAYAAYAYLGMVEYKRGDFDKSISYHEKAMDTFRNHKKNLIARKREFIKDLKTKVVNINNELDKHGLNNAHGGSSNMSLANSFMWQEIREKNPTYHMSKVNDIKNTAKALEEELLDDLRMSYPEFFLVQYGNSFLAKGDLEHALEAYKNALRVNPAYGLAYSNISSVFVAAGKLDLAKQYYNDAKKLNAPISPAVEKALR